ncbi:MAG: hypothetical protein IPK26_11430 [Planctomycetes bacterium]|nr:hypothetical protein [Planctomycetota bacterium]
MGRLPPDQEERLLLQALDIHDHSSSLANAQAKAEHGDPHDYLAFLRELYNYENTIACREMLRSGGYITVAQDTPLPPMPADYAFVGFPSFGEIDGKRVDVWFLIDLTKHQSALDARDHAEQVERHLVDEEALAFNSRDQESRMRAIQESDDALRAIRKSRSAAERADLRKKVIDSKFSVNRSTWTLQGQPRRRH